MLSSLRKVDQRTREAMLSGLALDLLPNTKSEDDIAADRHTLFADVCREAGVPPHDRSPESLRRLQEVLSNALHKAILDPSKVKEIRARVGYQGLLPISQYQVRFSQNFGDRSAAFGVSQELATKTIQRSRLVKHLLPGKFGPLGVEGVSLFLANHLNVPDRYSVVIFADRKADTLTVNAGWLVFHSDVRSCDLSDPLDVLEAFIDSYGVFITAGRQRRKFILYEIIPIVDGDNQVIRIDKLGGEDIEFDAHFFVRPQRESIEIAIAFAINVTAFAADLLRHNVRITRAVHGLDAGKFKNR